MLRHVALSCLVFLINPPIFTLANTNHTNAVRMRMKAGLDVSPLELYPAEFKDKRGKGYSGNSPGGKLCLVIAANLEKVLAPELDRFAADVTSAGFTATVTIMTGGTAEDLRAQLQAEPGLTGAILIGNIPRAWYCAGFSKDETFPFDLFLSDLDGTFTDSNDDGIYDRHSGDKQPEIWISRIDPHAMECGNEILFLKEYFAKNHLFRTGAMSVPRRALTFIDDDWCSESTCDLNKVYKTVTVVNDKDQTSAENFKNKLREGYEWVHLMAHSSPWGYQFDGPNGFSGTVFLPEIAQLNPKTIVYQLFACSNTRYTEPNCLGNWHLYGTDYALLCIGSTKTGGLWDYNSFYSPIGNGQIPGEGFKNWFSRVGITDPKWYYGCIMLGDPTIRPNSIQKTIPGNAEVKREPVQEYTRISSSTRSNTLPVCLTYKNKAWIAWITGENGRTEIAARMYNGSSWEKEVIVAADKYWDITPSLAVDNQGEPWLAWADFHETSYGYAIRLAHGSNFSRIEPPITSNIGYNTEPLLVYTDKMYVVWHVTERGEGDIVFRSVDQSGRKLYLSNKGAEDFDPCLVKDTTNTIHVAWVEGTALSSRILWCSGDAGGFSQPQALSSCVASKSPELALCNGTVFIIWQESDDFRTSIKTRKWDGARWNAEETAYQITDKHAFWPHIGTSGNGDIIAIWQIGNRAETEVWYSTYNAAGWSKAGRLLNPEGPAWFPAINSGMIVWAGTGGADQWHIFSTFENSTNCTGNRVSPVDEYTYRYNPQTGTIQFTVNTASPLPQEMTVMMFTPQGRKVYSRTHDVLRNRILTIPCAPLAKGAYTLLFAGKGIRKTLRIVIM